MNRKLAITIVAFFLGLATWDAFLDHKEPGSVGPATEEAQAFEDGTGVGVPLK